MQTQIRYIQQHMLAFVKLFFVVGLFFFWGGGRGGLDEYLD